MFYKYFFIRVRRFVRILTLIHTYFLYFLYFQFYMKYHKLVYLVISALAFSFIYSIMNPVHFHGLNKIQDKIKDDLIEDEANEPFY